MRISKPVETRLIASLHCVYEFLVYANRLVSRIFRHSFTVMLGVIALNDEKKYG